MTQYAPTKIAVGVNVRIARSGSRISPTSLWSDAVTVMKTIIIINRCRREGDGRTKARCVSG